MTNTLWWRVLRERGFDLDPAYLPRLFAAQAVAAVSSLASMRPRAPRQIDPSTIDVVFIIGHWRSGTTYLHQLLSADEARFSTLDTATATFPKLQGTPLLAPVLRALGLDRDYPRLFDNVMLGPRAPMELEYALMNSIGVSEYLCWTFPRAKWALLDYLRDAPESLPAEVNAAFRRAVVELTARLVTPGKIVLHKNPPSTACVAELAELFPAAKFVFLARRPAELYPSTLKTMRALNEVGRLQKGGDEDLEDYVIERYLRLHRAYLAQRGRLAPGRLFEARFQEIEDDPIELIARIHTHFGWSDFDERPYRAQLCRTANYRKNQHPPLDAATRARLQRAWSPVLEALELEL